MDETPQMSPPDPKPEAVLQAAYLTTFRRMRRWIIYQGLAMMVLAGVGGWAITNNASADTQHQIRQLVCYVVGNAKPDHGVVDYLRTTYRCRPYAPPRHVG